MDRSLGKHVVANALRAKGAIVEVHDDHFAQDTPDEDWLSSVGRRGWAVLSKDENIRKRPLELGAISDAEVGIFVLASKGLNGAQMAAIFDSTIGKIEAIFAETKRPFVCLLYRDGTTKRFRVMKKKGGHKLKRI